MLLAGSLEAEFLSFRATDRKIVGALHHKL
jgi:hypothetical protein